MNLETEELLLVCEKIKTGEENNIRAANKFIQDMFLSRLKKVGNILKKHACYIEVRKNSQGTIQGTVDIYIGLNTKLRLYYNTSQLELRGFSVIEDNNIVVVDGNDEELRWRRFIGYDTDGFARCVELKKYKRVE